MNYFIIFNPGARDGRSKKNLEAIKHYFYSNNLDYEIRTTGNLDDAKKFSIEANRKGYPKIIAVGGDGTINKVLNGFYNESGKRISKSRLGIIYTGTSPDFCKSYNIPYHDIKQSLQIIEQGKSIKIQVGKIILAKQLLPGVNRVTENSTHFTTAYFGCCANIGLGATLARLANSGIRKRMGDTFGTFLSLIKTLFIYKPVEMIYYSDGIKKRVQNIYNISIGRTYYIASGIKVNNTLKQGDGLFYNVIIKNLSLFSILPCLKAIYSGDKMRNNSNVSLSYSSVFELESRNHGIEVEFDGDPQGFLPCHIEMAEDSLDLIVGDDNG